MRGRCYWPYSNTTYGDWAEAFAYCLNRNSHLAILESKEEFTFVENMVLATGKPFWVSLKSNGSGMEWIAKEKYKDHMLSRPKDLCMVSLLISNEVNWQLRNCLANKSFYPLCIQGSFNYLVL